MCARLERAKPLTNLRSIIPEAYFPKIIRSKLNRAFPPRVANMILQDVNRTDATVEVADIERWRDRIYQAIDQGQVTDSNGKTISLSGLGGIDILGNIVESCALSPNKLLYGDLHNQGHNLISFIHDPEQKYLEEFGVMGDVTTAMRDPIFYRTSCHSHAWFEKVNLFSHFLSTTGWHGFIDTVFQRHKKLLPTYVANTELAYAGITVSSVSVQITKGKNAKANTLLTYWQKSDVDLSTGLDFGPEGNVYAQFTHLQHAPFEYTIAVENKASAQKIGTCRIFMCPKNDERGQAITKFEDQRSLMVEMDKFTVFMNPGRNIIRRRSDESRSVLNCVSAANCISHFNFFPMTNHSTALRFRTNDRSVRLAANSRPLIQPKKPNSNSADVDGHSTCSYQKVLRKAPNSTFSLWFQTLSSTVSISQTWRIHATMRRRFADWRTKSIRTNAPWASHSIVHTKLLQA